MQNLVAKLTKIAKFTSSNFHGGEASLEVKKVESTNWVHIGFYRSGFDAVDNGSVLL